MKQRWNTLAAQQELPFDADTQSAMRGRRRMPPEEAAWWFARMRETVDLAANAAQDWRSVHSTSFLTRSQN